jgi:hypothetical protein
MALISITLLTCDDQPCTKEFAGEGDDAYEHALECGWGYDLDQPERDLCPVHAVDPDDRGAC